MDREAARTVERVAHGSSDDPSLLDFSANANPSIPDGVTEVYEAALERSRSYSPEPPTDFRESAAEYVQCPPDRVIPTPGGMAALRLAIQLVVDPGDSVLVPAPSFGEYAREVRLQGGTPTFVDSHEILEADTADHCMAIVCNPNNPTGETYEEDTISTFVDHCRHQDTVVLLDEAFLDFTDQPSLAGVNGVIVARSLTKMFGLPGIRMGFAVSSSELLESLAGARPPWNVGMPALEVGTYCMQQTDFVSETKARVRSERKRLRAALNDRFEIYSSDSPFLLIDTGDRDVDELLKSARQQGLFLRDARTFQELTSHVRIAIRLPSENDRLIEFFKHV